MQTTGITNSHRAALVSGFWRGLACVAFMSPPRRARTLEFTPLPPAQTGSLADDWRRVGQYLRTAARNPNGER